MKSTKYILKVFIILLVFSCGQNSSKKNLIGKWYGIENNGYTRIHFYTDSLVYTEQFKESVDWNATASKIQFSLPNNMWFTDSSKDVTVYYRLSKNKDTLFGTFKNAFGENEMSLLKANNYFEYLHKRYGVNFSLPKDTLVGYLETEPIYGLKVLMGFINDKIITRTELSENLDHLESDINIFKDNVILNESSQFLTREQILDSRFHIRVFADKNISDSTITRHLPLKIMGQTNDSIPLEVYRIYLGKETENLNMKGKKIKTIANKVYKS